MHVVIWQNFCVGCRQFDSRKCEISTISLRFLIEWARFMSTHCIAFSIFVCSFGAKWNVRRCARCHSRLMNDRAAFSGELACRQIRKCSTHTSAFMFENRGNEWKLNPKWRDKKSYSHRISPNFAHFWLITQWRNGND